ncbi:hypothetical protein [Deinococcus fonticola]|uniref:hypothetical protein n=1 Tax=Deinococcus fonticola TaxID=2528713 RepID=UPI0010753CCA|nr:hypothetical protein [Deinococcus fonticola]
MSRGPGRVMRECIEVLGRYGRASTPELSAAVLGSSEAALGSTRRALRALTRRGVVACLGFTLGNERVWCLAAERDRYAAPWATGEGAAWFVEQYGHGRLACMVRLFNSSRYPLSAEQRAARPAGGSGE